MTVELRAERKTLIGRARLCAVEYTVLDDNVKVQNGTQLSELEALSPDRQPVWRGQ